MNSKISLKIIISLALVVLLGPAAIDMYLASMPEMAKELNTTYAVTQITLTVFLIFMGLGQLLFGPISDAYGRKKPLLIGIMVYILASFWAALAPTIESLILARILQGLAASMATVVIMSMVRDLVEDIAATQLYALLNTVVALGPIVAPAVGGLVGASYGWRGVMFVLMAVGIIVFFNTVINIQESLPQQKRNQLNFKSLGKIYWNIIKNKIFFFNLMAFSAVYFFLFTYIGGSSYVYQNEYGLSLEQFGLVFGLTSISLVLGASSSAYFIKKMTANKLAVIGALLMMIGSLICITTHFMQFGLVGIVIGIGFGLFGLGILEAVLMSIAMNSQQTSLGASAALLGAFPMLLSSIATPIAGYLVEVNTLYWLAFLGGIGPIILGFVVLGTQNVKMTSNQS